MQKNGVVQDNGVVAGEVLSDGPRPAMQPSAVTECRPPASADIFPGVGFRIRREITRPPYDASEMFKDFELADISDHLSGIQEMDYPVYARGSTIVGPLHRAPGEINYPVCCGGVVVNPGDIIVADCSGVVVVPQSCVEQLRVELLRHNERAAAYLEKVRKGEFSNAWVDQLLPSARCEIDG